MVEIFDNISQEVKDAAEAAWNFIISLHTPAEAAELLNVIVEYYKLKWTKEEVDFLQFYFRTQMEMINK